MWFNDSRAKRLIKNATEFLRERAQLEGTSNHANSPAHLANFYQLNGEQIPLDDVWPELNGGNTQRFRNEHSHLTIGMWAAAATGTDKPTTMEAFSRELLSFYKGGDFWEKTTDESGHNEDINTTQCTSIGFLRGSALLHRTETSVMCWYVFAKPFINPE